jgi:N-acetylmuramoyl-L-alanine amidase
LPGPAERVRHDRGMSPRRVTRRRAGFAVLAVVPLLAAACGSTHPTAATHSAAASAPAPTPTTAATTTTAPPAVSTTAHPSPSKRATTKPATTPPRTAAPPSAAAKPPPSGTGPLIVLDPGHSVTVHGTDPATGLDVSDYENEPEMRDVYAIALLVKGQLQSAGYRVLMTKSSLGDPTSLGDRSAVANSAHAALAVSIHDQAGTSGGIPFASGNNTVYYQSVGDYRTTSSGRRVTFTDAGVAALSKKYGAIFQTQRALSEGHAVTLLGNTGYDLGSRGLPAGNIWIVQLLSKVPWIYNEAGGNSPGLSGLNATDKQRYADGLVASIQRCVPVR